MLAAAASRLPRDGDKSSARSSPALTHASSLQLSPRPGSLPCLLRLLLLSPFFRSPRFILASVSPSRLLAFFLFHLSPHSFSFSSVFPLPPSLTSLSPMSILPSSLPPLGRLESPGPARPGPGWDGGIPRLPEAVGHIVAIGRPWPGARCQSQPGSLTPRARP